AAAHVRRHTFTVGRAVEFDPEAPDVSALEYLLGALGADVLAGLRAAAKRRRLRVDAAEAAVEGRLDNPLAHLGVVGEHGHAGLARADVRVYVSTPDPEPAMRAAWAEALERSPLVRTLRASVALALELHVVD
ncbi:MAG TPA: OsmC family protein, partial [Longimicrobiales bacterium]|nr:OsmC family protein [Longimicrobiales bacterium]